MNLTTMKMWMLAGSGLALAAACGGETPGAESQPAATVMEQLGDCPASPRKLEGVVKQVDQVSRYTYIKLRSSEGIAWAAVLRSNVSPGDVVRIVHALPVKDFRSPSTGRVFPLL